MPSGHTDRATINERRPLTPGMVSLLKMLRAKRIRYQYFSRTSKAPLRALMDRGLVSCSPEGIWSITESGLGMIVDDRSA